MFWEIFALIMEICFAAFYEHETVHCYCVLMWQCFDMSLHLYNSLICQCFSRKNFPSYDSVTWQCNNNIHLSILLDGSV